MFNKGELILDKVRSLVAYTLDTNKMMFRLTSLEEPTLSCTAESEEVTDAIGSVITTLYRAKRATFSATNSLISLDLAAAQFGATKEVADTGTEITDYTYEIVNVASGSSTVTLKHTPTNEIRYIYSIVDGEIGTAYESDATASADKFSMGEDGEITVPTGFVGKLYIEYQYANANAMKVTNNASQFPEACSIVIYAYFKDKCNENIVYSGKIICPRAKLNPEQVELALTSTGKHAFEFTINKDYCADEGEDELFSIIISQQ